ncbi:hypothetical protein [Sulfitobacter sp. JL08]|uniref:hypothetical protein n=1 Tax=unclassified Sulfitobacter TaxID=196795 RepID=UPI0020C7E89E|nr:hypothetical protein [Sulfitobacter sp. JL08]
MIQSRDILGRRNRARLRYFQSCARRRIPPGLRTILGVICVALGVVGFLPIVGFWMFPLGIALVWLDLGPLLRLRKSR